MTRSWRATVRWCSWCNEGARNQEVAPGATSDEIKRSPRLDLPGPGRYRRPTWPTPFPCSADWESPHAVSPVPARQPGRREVLWRVWSSPRRDVPGVPRDQPADEQVLPPVRRVAHRGAEPGAVALAGELHAEAPRGEDPDLQGRPRGRAQAGHRTLRRPEGLDGAPRRPRSRRGAQAPRPGTRADDGGRPPLRGHRESGHGRRDHGAVRGAAGPRGSRGAGVL